MGAAASVETTSRGAYDEVAEGVHDTTNALEGEISEINTSDIPDVDLSEGSIQSRIDTVVENVGEVEKESVVKLLNEAKDKIPAKEMGQALSEIEKILPSAEGAAVVVAVAGAVGSVSSMAPEIVGLIGTAVLSLGEHLPYLGVAAGCAGAIIYTFRLSKDQDKNIKTVTVWLQSVKDWLLLVAEKISISSAASTIPLFKALQEGLLDLSTQMDERNRKWRITKMLSSTQFERDFTRVKNAVLELKTALRDFLDEETQIRQESKLGSIADAQLETNEKLASIDDQLGQIRDMLREQAEEQARAQEANKNNTMQVKDEEESVFLNIQRAAGVEGDVPFKRFISVFEAFFYNSDDIPPEQKRGLNISLDTTNSGSVTKANWIKFYRKWTASGQNMEAYLVGIAEANPTVYQKGVKLAKDALASHGIENVEDAKAALAKKASDMKSIGMSMNPFGKKGQGNETTAESS